MRFIPVLFLAASVCVAADWPMFRGERAAGLSSESAPVQWNADPASGPVRNIKWKTPIPGLGHSSPILWGGALYVATAVRESGEAPLKLGLYGSGDSADDQAKQSWKIFKVDSRSGRIVWEVSAHEGTPRAARHTKATHANTTLATDGKYLVGMFGSEGLYCYDLDGKLRWKKDLGVLDMGPNQELQWGYASSPALHAGRIVILSDSKSGPFLASFDAATGKEIWRTSRQGTSSRSWSTPAVLPFGEATQVIANGWPHIAGYDFESGKELWRLVSEGDIPVPTPILAGGLVYVTNAHGGKAPLYAIRPTAHGDITPASGSRTNQHLAWSEERNGAYMQTPIVHEGLLYSCSDRGVLKCYDARTGRRHYEQRLGAGLSGFSSSPVAAGNHLYFSSEDGEVFVIKAGRDFQQAAVNKMGESVMATPAAAGGVLYFRTRSHLVAVGK